MNKAAAPSPVCESTLLRTKLAVPVSATHMPRAGDGSVTTAIRIINWAAAWCPSPGMPAKQALPASHARIMSVYGSYRLFGNRTRDQPTADIGKIYPAEP
jgi:hypothetical protein